jgi:hypothetical protein
MHHRFSLLIILSIFSVQLWAVDADVLWLPKKFNDIKPKLMTVATEVESSGRCTRVVAGEMDLSKTTEDSYYFIITCRDEGRRTYNVSYEYARSSDEFNVVNEQIALAVSDNQTQSLNDDEQASAQLLALCYQNFNVQGADKMCRGGVDEQRIEELCTEAKNFDAALALCNQPLTADEALASCREILDDEAILFGRIEVLQELINQQPHNDEWAFRFQIPFDNKARKGELIHYKADCLVSAEGDVDLSTRIDKDAIPGMCIEAVEKETNRMLGVTILTEQVSAIVEDSYNFYLEVPFNAQDPVGGSLHYKADCNVDDSGRTRVDISPREIE